MSKLRKPIFALFFAFSVIVSFSSRSFGQYVDAEVRIDTAAASAKISGKWSSGPRRNLSFMISAIGAPSLGSRISNVELKDADGRQVAVRAFNPAEYVAERDFSNFSYDIDLKPLTDTRSAGHASWISREEGLLFPDDLLPQAGAGEPKMAMLSFGLSGGWRIATTDKSEPNGIYRIANVERSVFVIGRNLRGAGTETETPVVAISGSWLFDDADAANMTVEIYREYRRIFGGGLTVRPLVVLLPMPQDGAQKGLWDAETRGSTVVIASSDMPFKSQSLQRLHEQLRHELFHLWIPNGLNLKGRYDWFYEGFALYQSLKTGVALNRIRFDDFLDTLSRAHNIDRSQTQRLSLVEASRQRWNGADTQLYARGIVVAFLCDLTLLQSSNGKLSIEGLLGRLYSAHEFPASAVDANTAVLKLFQSDAKLATLAVDHIQGAKPIDWAAIIETAGLENDPGTSRTSLRTKAKPSGRQRALLDKLGYNNWRKLTRK